MESCTKILFLKDAKENPNSNVAILVNNRDIFMQIDSVNNIIYDENAYMKCHASWQMEPLQFPPPKDININMMPIQVNYGHIILPDYLRDYEYVIFQCIRHQAGGWEKTSRVVYLTTAIF